MLSDRVLFDHRHRSGKSLIVDKSPINAFLYQEVRSWWPRRGLSCWSVTADIVNAHDGRCGATAIDLVCRYGTAVDAAIDGAQHARSCATRTSPTTR
jgi:hypothetical protein